MKELPLISVALCTYNGAAFLTEQVMSILGQSYPNIELVIVDDHSEDETWDLVQDFAARFPVIKAYRNDVNLGFNKNFERALGLSQGAFVAISDQDDVWLPAKVEELHAAIGDSWLVASNSAYIDAEGELTGELLRPAFTLEQASYSALLLNNLVTGHTCLLRRDLLEHILPIPENGYYDWWIGFVALYHEKIVYLDRPLTHHRLHPDSVMQKQEGREKREIIYRSITDQLQCFLDYKDLRENDRQFILDLKKSLDFTHRRFSSYALAPWIVHYYDRFFPALKKRNLFSKFNFALRFTNRLK